MLMEREREIKKEQITAISSLVFLGYLREEQDIENGIEHFREKIKRLSLDERKNYLREIFEFEIIRNLSFLIRLPYESSFR